jgi:hypothetical protein
MEKKSLWAISEFWIHENNVEVQNLQSVNEGRLDCGSRYDQRMSADTSYD